MSFPENPIIFKTSDQLRRQLQLVNLNIINQGGYRSHPIIRPPQEAFESPSSFSPLNGEQSQQYSVYLTELRNLRQQQFDYIPDLKRSSDTEIESSGDNRTNLEMLREIAQARAKNRQDSSYMDFVSFSRDITVPIIRKLNSTRPWSDEIPPLSDREYKAALNNNSWDSFLSVVNTILDRRPVAFYKNTRALKEILPPERIREIVMKTDQYFGLLGNFGIVKDLFSTDERKALIAPLLSQDPISHSIIQLFKDPDAVSLFRPDEVRKSIMRALELNFDISISDAAFYIHQEIISPVDLQMIITDRATNFRQINGLDQFIPLLPEDGLDQIRQELISIYLEHAQGENLRMLDITMRTSSHELLTPDQWQDIIERILDRDPNGLSDNIECIERRVPQQNQRLILKNLISQVLATDGLTIHNVKGISSATCLTTEDMEEFIRDILERGRGQLLLGNEFAHTLDFCIDINLKNIPAGKKRDDLAKVIFTQCDPDQVASSISYWRKVVSPDCTREILASLENNHRCLEILINNHTNWMNHLEPEFNQAFLNRHAEIHAGSMLANLDHIISQFTSNEQQRNFLSKLIGSDPLVAIIVLQQSHDVIRNIDPNISVQSIIADALRDNDRLSFTPRVLRNIYRQLSLETPLIDQPSLVMEAHQIYQAIAYIRNRNLEEDYRRVQSTQDIPAASERDSLFTFYCFAILRDFHPDFFAHGFDYGNTLEESRQVLCDQISRVLDLDRTFNPEEIARFSNTMETPIPFIIYLLQYEKFPEHKKLLKEIFESIMDGKFNEWKYVATTDEDLNVLKQAHLIPDQLSIEQYLIWQTDQQTTLFESLETDIQTTASTVSNYIQANLEHLHIENVMNSLLAEHPDEDPLTGIQLQLGVIGQQLASTNRELSQLRRQSTQDISRIDELAQQKSVLENTRRELLRVRRIVRLFTISADEIATSCFSEGNDRKQRGEELNKVLGELSSSASIDDQFVYEEIRNIIQTSRSALGGKQNLVCTDSSDPKIWIEIGENPVASCQSYNSGSYNECLVGYTDPNTKILVLRNERGKVIARSIFRLLKTTDGNPALHIERVYSSTSSKGILRSIFTRAYQKANEMGVPLLISAQSQDAGGGEEEFEITNGYIAEAVDYNLISESSRAPKVYVDSAGGVSYSGAYKMTGLLEIKQAA